MIRVNGSMRLLITVGAVTASAVAVAAPTTPSPRRSAYSFIRLQPAPSAFSSRRDSLGNGSLDSSLARSSLMAMSGSASSLASEEEELPRLSGAGKDARPHTRPAILARTAIAKQTHAVINRPIKSGIAAPDSLMLETPDLRRG